MKHGKKPTVRQKKLLQKFKLNPDNWLVVTENKEQITIVQRSTGHTKTINTGGCKYAR